MLFYWRKKFELNNLCLFDKCQASQFKEVVVLSQTNDEFIFKTGEDGGLSKSLIGGKAWSIFRMVELDIPVPPAFVISTDACKNFYLKGEISKELADDIKLAIKWLEEKTNRTFGSGPKPLLVSVRSGAEVSMPGMMDTILNLGSNIYVQKYLANEFSDPDFSKATFKKFLELYSEIVLKQPVSLPYLDTPEALIKQTAEQGVKIPEDPYEQLIQAIEAVFSSWNSRRAKRYRKHNNISNDLGTAVTVQTMVFGNLDDRSGTGVYFTRNPLNGDNQPFGEYLENAQGEDIVSGKRTPKPLKILKLKMPLQYEELIKAGNLLESEHLDMQDIEFTIEKERLYLLQSRSAKRSAAAAVKVVVDMVLCNILSVKEALERLSINQIREITSPILSEKIVSSATVLVQGEPAGPGVGKGIVVVDPDEAERLSNGGVDVVLVRATTSPDDIHGMIASRAVVTEVGGSTSHAAVVGRSLGLPTVVKIGEGRISALEGCEVTVDGNSGRVYEGLLETEKSVKFNNELRTLSKWLEELTPLDIVDVDDNEKIPIHLDLKHNKEMIDLGVSQRLLIEGKYLSGKVFESEEAVRMAIELKARGLVVSNKLLAMFVAVKG